MLAELMRLRAGIAIAGTHGKDDNDVLVTAILRRGGPGTPPFVIGGKLTLQGASSRLGQASSSWSRRTRAMRASYLSPRARS